jgi:hypothetical protein
MPEPIQNPSEPAAAATISLPVEEYQRLKGLEAQVDELRSARTTDLDAKEAERIKSLAERGRIEEALSRQRQALEAKLGESAARFAELERQIFDERKAAVIAQAFAGRSFVGDGPERQAEAAMQVRALLESRFETVRDASGSLVVRDKASGRAAADVIRETLDSASYAHFFAPSSRGGAGGDATRSAPSPKPPKPGSLDFIAAEFKARQASYGSFGMHPIPGR